MLCSYNNVGVVIAAAGLVAVPPAAAPLPGVQVRAVQLTSADAADSLGDGTAFAMGPSGFPLPPQRFADAADMLYLQPHGFGGDAQVLFTPVSNLFPTDVYTSEYDGFADFPRYPIGRRNHGQPGEPDPGDVIPQ